MKGRTILIINYLLLIIFIIGVGLMIPYILPATIDFVGSPKITAIVFGILLMTFPSISLYFAFQNIKTWGWQLRNFGIFDRIINYTPFLQIFCLLLILVYILLNS